MARHRLRPTVVCLPDRRWGGRGSAIVYLRAAVELCRNEAAIVPAGRIAARFHDPTGVDLRRTRELPADGPPATGSPTPVARPREDRKSTRLNSSHQIISYAVFCLKKKKNKQSRNPRRAVE